MKENNNYKICVYKSKENVYTFPYSFSSLLDADKFCTQFTNKESLTKSLEQYSRKSFGNDIEIKLFRYIDNKPIEINPILYEYDKEVLDEEYINNVFNKDIKSPIYVHFFIKRIMQSYTREELESMMFCIRSIKKTLCSDGSFEEVYNKYLSPIKLLLSILSGHELHRIIYLAYKECNYGDVTFDFGDQKIDPNARDGAKISLQSLKEYMQTDEYIQRTARERIKLIPTSNN